ncbi:MAG: NAD-dependent epimerase/dehydratase family protein [Lautropia sp.]
MRPFDRPAELKVLITGAAGRIGVVLRQRLGGRYGLLRLLDIAAQQPAAAGEDVVRADIGDREALRAALSGIDCVVHLAGIPTEADWDRILAANVVGTYNVFEAARLAGVRRVVFASSNHAIGFYRRDVDIDTDVVPRPDSRYGVSKVFGEALGRMYADKYGLSVACLRIGPFRTPDRPMAERELMNWISHRDMAQLVRRCIEHPDFHYLVAYGVSGNTRGRWHNAGLDFLGYRPEDDAEAFASEILAQPASEDPVAAQFHGGRYCSAEFVGDASRIDARPSAEIQPKAKQ